MGNIFVWGIILIVGYILYKSFKSSSSPNNKIVASDKAFSINEKGQQLENQNQIDKAINIYEKGVRKNTDTPFTYRRLAILYRKKKDRDNEIRVIRKALENVPASNKKHYEWFKERLNMVL